ncbi:MAG: helix-turn-helix transcriptional regulator [Alphaproteobacteria bacterium]|nr:helix-turn-helix transcriptional regulator [Alphaproteobacteria bacterium]
MVVGCQIRAARALLDMSQDELAKAAGLTPQAIRKIESGDVQPREGTIADIVRVFHERRLEFTDNQGVRFRPEDVEVLNGPEGVQRFFDKVYELAQKSGGVIRQNGISDSTFLSVAPDATKGQGRRMAPLVQKRKDIFVRALLPYGDQNFAYSEYAQYRWYPDTIPAAVPFYSFGDSIGIFAFDADISPKIILVTSPAIVAAYEKQFDETWNMAPLPQKTT